ncbi:hypothetical protein Leryth_023021 [Lithospermum erythrorhizon]|nr:hypothetical protein Leryth_023021 [Lithospermum erythrorhizon]
MSKNNISSQVGFLVPLNENLEEVGDEIPEIPIVEGANVVGRNCVPIADKRLSRKHLTLNADIDGSAEIFVDGTNPVVIRMNNERKKLSLGEKWRIGDGDLIELIPGLYFFKYVVKAGDEEKSPKDNQKRCFSEASCSTNFQGSGKKKIRQGSEEEEFSRTLKNERQHTFAATEHSSEGIRHFKVSGDTLPLTFRLMRVRELPPWANTNSVSISDVIEGDIQVAILSNYMVDLDWLISACPAIKEVPHVLVIHGEGDGKLEYMKRMKTSGWILHKPPLPISYGTHHSKAMFLIYPRGVRIIVHTANLIYVDWNNKSQGLWMQDFPWKDENSSSKGCLFESDLVDYLGALKWPDFTVNLPGVGSCNINPHFFRKFDYSGATVRLIASVPGYHSGPNLKKWGHMKLRTVLQECTFDSVFQKSPLVYQFSSLGSLDEKWMTELTASLSAGVSEDKKPLGLGQPSLIWPTVEDVRCSIEGYAAGSCIPSPQKNVEKDFLNKYWAKWKASHFRSRSCNASHKDFHTLQRSKHCVVFAHLLKPQ